MINFIDFELRPTHRSRRIIRDYSFINFFSQPSDHRVLGASLRKRRFFVPQGPEETGVGQSETSV